MILLDCFGQPRSTPAWVCLGVSSLMGGVTWPDLTTVLQLMLLPGLGVAYAAWSGTVQYRTFVMNLKNSTVPYCTRTRMGVTRDH